MGTYPTSPRESFMDWCRVHRPTFLAHAAAIGLSPAQADDFAQAVEEAFSAEEASAAATQAARTATQVALMKVDRLRLSARATVGLIKAFAQQTGNTNIYTLAELPTPATPSTMPPPGQPMNLTVGLDPTTGALELRWKARNPAGSQGTAYIIRRRMGAGGIEAGVSPETFEFIGVTGEKRFVDSTLHGGQGGGGRVEYTVQAQRGDTAGPVSPILVVNFGTPSLSTPTIVPATTPGTRHGRSTLRAA